MILALTEQAKEHQLPGHPERPERVVAALDGIRTLDLGSSLEICAAQPAEEVALRRVHSKSYLQALESLARSGGGRLDPDTYVTSSSWNASRLSAGAGLTAVRTLRERRDGLALVVARPPGHHALPERGMGFCLLNNVAIAAAELADAGERVLIVDWDVHHGNGTQDIFYQDDRVLYASVHEYGIYPGTGRPQEIGEGSGHGLTINVPVPPGATGDVVRSALDDVVAPVVQRFTPTWVLVSAGFDAHRADPLADLQLSSRDFADLAATVAQYAPTDGRLVLFLEGGYDLGALRESMREVVASLVGARDDMAGTPTSGGPGREWVIQAGDARRRLEG